MKAREAVFSSISYVLSCVFHSKWFLFLASLATYRNGDSVMVTDEIRTWFKKFGLYIALATVFFLYLVNAFWAGVNGRLLPDGTNNSLQFFEDIPNIINYTIICTVYVTFCICFLMHIGKLRTNMFSNQLLKESGFTRPPEFAAKWSLIFWSVLVVFFGTFTIAHYAEEIGQSKNIFWFQSAHQSGAKLLTAHGYYYIFMNLILNFIVCATAAAHFELFAVSSLISKQLKKIHKRMVSGSVPREKVIMSPIMDNEKYRDIFSPFNSMYLLSKVVAVALLANMYTWRAEETGTWKMLPISILLLSVAATAAVSFPRYHIQYWLFKVRLEAGKSDYPDIRGPFVAGIANCADVLILGAAMTNLVVEVLKRSGIDINIFY